MIVDPPGEPSAELTRTFPRHDRLDALIRQVLAQAAQVKGLCPRQLSFAGALQTLEAFRWLLLYCGDAQRGLVWRSVLVALGTHKVGNRPGRCEPRRRKRRPKNDGYLTKPRAQARAELLQE